MENPKRVIKIMTVTTVIAAILASVCGVTMMANATWVNIISTACSLTCAFIAMAQLLLVKQAYNGYKDDSEYTEEDE